MNAPKIRFKDNDGSKYPKWEEQTFDYIFAKLNNNTFSRDCLNYESGNFKNIHYGDIHTKYGSIVDAAYTQIPFINDNIDCKKYDLLRDGDVIFADTAEDETVGKAIEIQNIKNEAIIAGLHTMAWRPKYTFSPCYLGYYLNSSAYHNQLRPYMQGIKVTSVNKENIVKTTIAFPSLSEQQKIANFFSTLDEIISSIKEKLEVYKQLKKGYMQKIFSQQIRFKDDDGNEYPKWEEVKLDKILKEYSEKYQNDGTYEHASLTTEGIVLKTERYNREALVTHKNKEYKITHYDDICYNPANLKFGVITRNKLGDVIFSPIYITFKVNHNYLPSFIEYLLTRKNFIDHALKYQEGTVYERMAVKPQDLLSIYVKVPSLQEQQKIANFFSTFDDVINNCRKELDSYQNLKRGFMQKMFV